MATATGSWYWKQSRRQKSRRAYPAGPVDWVTTVPSREARAAAGGEGSTRRANRLTREPGTCGRPRTWRTCGPTSVPRRHPHEMVVLQPPFPLPPVGAQEPVFGANACALDEWSFQLAVARGLHWYLWSQGSYVCAGSLIGLGAFHAVTGLDRAFLIPGKTPDLPDRQERSPPAERHDVCRICGARLAWGGALAGGSALLARNGPREDSATEIGTCRSARLRARSSRAGKFATPVPCVHRSAIWQGCPAARQALPAAAPAGRGGGSTAAQEVGQAAVIQELRKDERPVSREHLVQEAVQWVLPYSVAIA
jgi:hypothetical protein